MRVNQWNIWDVVTGTALIICFSSLGLARRWTSDYAIDYYRIRLPGVVVKHLSLMSLYKPHEREAIRRFIFSQAKESPSAHEKACIRYNQNDLRLVSTPFLYSVMAWISTENFSRDYAVYRWVSSVVFIGGILLLGWRLSLPFTLTALLVGALTFLSPFFREEISVGGVNQIQTGLLSLIIFLQPKFLNRWGLFAGGGLLALMVFFKPNIYLVLAGLFFVFAFTHQKSILVWGWGLLSGALAAFLLSYWTMGEAGSWRDWVHYGLALRNRPEYVVKSLVSFLFGLRVAMSNPWINALIQIGLFFAVLVSAHRWFKLGGQKQIGMFFVVAMSLATNLLSGRCVHLHYYLLLTPLVILSLKGVFIEAWPMRRMSALSLSRILMGLSGIGLLTGLIPLSNYYQEAYFGTMLLYAHNLWFFSAINPLSFSHVQRVPHLNNFDPRFGGNS